MYSLWQVCPSAVNANCNTIAGNPKTINYMLNRTTDGSTWTLNSSATGIVVATANSTQPNPKFGTVNALLGGVNHAAVDPATGDLYYVYGNRDASGNNRLAIRRVFDNGSGGVTIGSESFVVAGTVQAALPSVAVTDDGVVGVFYRGSTCERTRIHERLRDYYRPVADSIDVGSARTLGDLSPLIEQYFHTVRAEHYEVALLLFNVEERERPGGVKRLGSAESL